MVDVVSLSTPFPPNGPYTIEIHYGYMSRVAEASEFRHTYFSGYIRPCCRLSRSFSLRLASPWSSRASPKTQLLFSPGWGMNKKRYVYPLQPHPPDPIWNIAVTLELCFPYSMSKPTYNVRKIRGVYMVFYRHKFSSCLSRWFSWPFVPWWKCSRPRLGIFQYICCGYITV